MTAPHARGIIAVMNVGLLLIHVVSGGLIAAHGAQKLSGWLGSAGPDGTGAFFE
jgi:putative oxidoreductase